jgi:hypothetical protein
VRVSMDLELRLNYDMATAYYYAYVETQEAEEYLSACFTVCAGQNALGRLVGGGKVGFGSLKSVNHTL